MPGRPDLAAAPLAENIDVTVRVLDPAWRRLWPAAVRRARNAARVALGAADQPAARFCVPMELTIALADDGTVRSLNREYRGIDKPTNVLSFDGTGGGRHPAVGAPSILGDVILARQTVATEAATQGKSIGDHAAHLVVHGVLHLLGYDHCTAREADLMEAIEVRVLARLGMANPYVGQRPRRGTRRRA